MVFHIAGLPGILCVGGTDRHHPALPLLLSHGDVIILSGASRTAYHAVPRVFDTFQPTTCWHDSQENDTLSYNSSTDEHIENVSDWITSFVSDLREKHSRFYHPLDLESYQTKVLQFLLRTRVNISIRQVEKYY